MPSRRVMRVLSLACLVVLLLGVTVTGLGCDDDGDDDGGGGGGGDDGTQPPPPPPTPSAATVDDAFFFTVDKISSLTTSQHPTWNDQYSSKMTLSLP